MSPSEASSLDSVRGSTWWKVILLSPLSFILTLSWRGHYYNSPDSSHTSNNSTFSSISIILQFTKLNIRLNSCDLMLNQLLFHNTVEADYLGIVYSSVGGKRNPIIRCIFAVREKQFLFLRAMTLFISEVKCANWPTSFCPDGSVYIWLFDTELSPRQTLMTLFQIES